jgi:MFS family permease
MSDGDRIGWRIQSAVYACGALNHSMGLTVSVIMPLWLIELEASYAMIGIALGARHILPLFLSIHGGALMDRFGTRRIMIWFALISATGPILYPAMPWIWAVIMLQMIMGLSETMGWSGAQAMIGQIMKGSETYAGRLSFSVRIGHFIGPLLIGAAWDWQGPWGAFATLSVLGSCAFVAVLYLPKVTGAVMTEQRSATARDLVPRFSDYADAFRLLAIPAVLFVVMISFVRHSSTSMQSSFYVVYLESVSISATEIGLLFAASATMGAMGALATGRLTNYMEPAFFLVLSTLGTIIFMGATPLLGAYALLMIVFALRGSCLGFSQVLMISILGRALDPTTQGKGVGLRTTINRVMNASLPPMMGAIVEIAGLENGFYIICGVAAALTGLISIHAWRHNAFRDRLQ